MSVLRSTSRATGKLHTNPRQIHSRIRFGQGWINIMFLWHVFSLLRFFCSTFPYGGQNFNKSTGNIDQAFFFNTMTLPCFDYFYDLFYVGRIKIVPAMIYDLLTPIGLAYLIMGDGSFHKRDHYVILCTEGFTNSDNALLMSVLVNKFGLSCRLSRHKETSRIVIRRESLALLQSLVVPYIIPSMLYRVGL